MGGCSLLLTHEVRAWLAALDDDDFGRVAFYLDLLCQRRGQLEAPCSRRLPGRLYRLGSPGRRRGHRLTYRADVTARWCCSRSSGGGVAATTSSNGPRPGCAADPAHSQQERKER